MEYDPTQVSQEHRIETIRSIVYKLQPGSKSKTDASLQVVLRSFESGIFNDDRRSFLTNELKKIYHHMPLSLYDMTISDFENTQKFQNSNAGDRNWLSQLALDQQIFVKFSKSSNVGCPHYIRGCQLKCETCDKFYTCRLCHDDDEDHVFPRYDTTIVRCLFCSFEQKIGDKCQNCGISFGSYYCDKCNLICGMGNHSKPNYHCDFCNMCMVGLPQYSQHCNSCNACFNKRFFQQHKCIQQRSECMICLMDLAHSIYGRVILECHHQLHSHCYLMLLQKGNYKCPLCKRFLPVGADREWILKCQTKFYRRIFVEKHVENIFVKAKCNDCQTDFISMYHPLYYLCPQCLQFNCDFLEEINSNQLKSLYHNLSNRQSTNIQPRFCNFTDLLGVIIDIFCGELDGLDNIEKINFCSTYLGIQVGDQTRIEMLCHLLNNQEFLSLQELHQYVGSN